MIVFFQIYTDFFHLLSESSLSNHSQLNGNINYFSINTHLPQDNPVIIGGLHECGVCCGKNGSCVYSKIFNVSNILNRILAILEINISYLKIYSKISWLLHLLLHEGNQILSLVSILNIKLKCFYLKRNNRT